MRKVTAFLLFLCLGLISCEKEDSEPQGNEGNQMLEGKRLSKEFIKYEGNPVYKDQKIEYEYEDGKIVKEELFHLQSTEWIPDTRKIYEYQSNKVVIRAEKNVNLIEWEQSAKDEYFFMDDKISEFKRYQYESDWELVKHVQYEYSGDRLINATSIRYNLGTDEVETLFEYQYNDQSMPTSSQIYLLNQGSDYELAVIEEYTYESEKLANVIQKGVDINSVDTTYDHHWKIVYDYMGDKLEEKNVEYTDDEGTLVHEESEMYLYDEDGSLKEVSFSQTGEDPSIPTKRIFEYEEGGANHARFEDPMEFFLPDPTPN